jgi:hypothetical protein
MDHLEQARALLKRADEYRDSLDTYLRSGQIEEDVPLDVVTFTIGRLAVICELQNMALRHLVEHCQSDR